MTAAGLYAATKAVLHPSPHDDAFAVSLLMFGVFFFGLAPIVGVIFLCRSSLTLSKVGFEFIGLNRQQYRWDEVSDFGVVHVREALVVFKTTRRTKTWSTFLTGGRDGGFPDTYGLGAGELVQLMETWKRLVMPPS